MRTLTTAVVGLGRIGWQYHIPQILQYEGFALAAVVDPLAERRAEALATFGVQGYDSYDALLDGERLDLVVLASPTHLHADQAIAAMERGVDVFCDKPMAPSLEEADRMIAAAARTGRKLMVYQPHRVQSDSLAVRHILQSGLLGDIFMIKRTMAHYTRRNDWQAFTQYGGGMLNNYGAHAIDNLLYLTGSRATSISCVLRRIATQGDADDVVKALIRLENGILIDLEIDMACALPMPTWTLLGRFGAAILADGENFTVRYYDPADLPALPPQASLAAAKRQYGNDEVIPWRTMQIPLADFPVGDFYAHCYDYFALDQPPFVPLCETRELMRTIDACRKNAGD